MRRGVSARRNPHRHHAAEARPLRTRRTCSWAWHAAVNPQTYVVMAFEIPLCAARAPLPWWHASMRRRHTTTRCRSRPEFLSKDFCARWQVAARAVERDARQVPSHAQHLLAWLHTSTRAPQSECCCARFGFGVVVELQGRRTALRYSRIVLYSSTAYSVRYQICAPAHAHEPAQNHLDAATMVS